jgi:hypothetical protein
MYHTNYETDNNKDIPIYLWSTLGYNKMHSDPYNGKVLILIGMLEAVLTFYMVVTFLWFSHLEKKIRVTKPPIKV